MTNSKLSSKMAGLERRPSAAVNQEKKPANLDMSIMGTNDSSIVSKRSVERLYYPEPHFFRHFVKKPKRRSPLINRGYWLRMQAIEHELKHFLVEVATTAKKKVVVNLGCGYDPLPFHILGKYPDLIDQVLFLDIDYPYLLKSKVSMIQAATEIMELLGDVQLENIPGRILASENYSAVGCDLSDLNQLESFLKSFLCLSDCTFFFIAEVSITYMEDHAADSLINWAATLGNAKFCLLEQCLPWGERHPFAETMLKHFAKLGTKLKSLKNHPTVRDQEKRFRRRGWQQARAQSLWQKWADPTFLTSEERIRLNSVEPFDEWEDFALFAHHYFVLIASTSVEADAIGRLPPDTLSPILDLASYPPDSLFVEADLSRKESKLPARSHGALFESLPGIFCYHGGYGFQKRLATSDVLSKPSKPSWFNPSIDARIPPLSIGERMGHTITTYNAEFNCLLVGGRASPERALADCWVRQEGRWHEVESLPNGIYRHCATAVIIRKEASLHNPDGSSVLVYGGKSSNGSVLDQWLLWRPGQGWIRLRVHGEKIEPRFGSSMAAIQLEDLDSTIGFMLGGMTQDGIVVEECVIWRFSSTEDIQLSKIRFDHISGISRFGAVLCVREPRNVDLERRGIACVVGGIAGAHHDPDHYLPVSIFEYRVDEVGQVSISASLDKVELSARTRPLLTGHAAVLDQSGLLISGGGATCFSFGSYANDSTWYFSAGELIKPAYSIVSNTRHDREPSHLQSFSSAREPTSQTRKSAQTVSIDVLNTQVDFRKVLLGAKPKVMRGLSLGPCTSLWLPEYLQQRLGDKEVTVHYSESQALNFQDKNFSYRKLPFAEFIDAIVRGGHHYLRALSTISTDQPADFWRDYPELAEDFRLPPELGGVICEDMAGGQSRMHSSVFRVSGPVAMWLHYDVMANVLCQIRGSKRLLLFPPTDVTHLAIPPGQSSSPLNMFDPETYEKHDLGQVHPHEVLLQPGDVLSIPAFWLHTAQPTQGVSIAVNVFFRDLDSGYATGRDAYGNRDLQAYEDGRRDLQRVAGRFAKLPQVTRDFYMQRLAEELKMLAK